MDSARTHRLNVTINGNTYLVEIDDLNTSPLTVKVNGQTYTVDIETAEVEEVPVEQPVEPAADATRFSSVADATLPSTGPDGADEKMVRAPMPGNITHIAVKPGDQVSIGQELCLLEAMKMNNAIRSPCAGVIASVEASLGQAVNHGDILLTFK